MDFNEYQRRAKTTAIYPGQGEPLGLTYVGLKLTGEAGEVSDKIGKLIRDKGLMVSGQIAGADRIALLKEGGDVLWYLAALATQLGFNLDDMARMNLDRRSGGVSATAIAIAPLPVPRSRTVACRGASSQAASTSSSVSGLGISTARLTRRLRP